MPSVVSHHETAGCGAGVEEILDQTGCGPTNHEPIHPGRTGTERTSQPRGPELQTRRETARDLPGIGAHERFEFAARDGVGVLLEPKASLLQSVAGHLRILPSRRAPPPHERNRLK